MSAVWCWTSASAASSQNRSQKTEKQWDQKHFKTPEPDPNWLKDARTHAQPQKISFHFELHQPSHTQSSVHTKLVINSMGQAKIFPTTNEPMWVKWVDSASSEGSGRPIYATGCSRCFTNLLWQAAFCLVWCSGVQASKQTTPTDWTNSFNSLKSLLLAPSSPGWRR